MKNYLALSLVAVVMTFSLASCKKDQDSAPPIVSKNDFSAFKEQVDQWYNARMNSIRSMQSESENEKTKTAAQYRTATDYAEAFQTDTSFVTLCYKILNNVWPMIDHYQMLLGSHFSEFSSAMSLTGSYSTASRTFTAYGVSENPFFDTHAHIFASCTYLYDRYPDFEFLPYDQQVNAINAAVAYNFGANAFGGEKLQVSLMGNVQSCLIGAVGNYILGNWQLVKAIHGALTGSRMGYAFVYATAGRILKQSLVSVGGVWGIAASFAICMIF